MSKASEILQRAFESDPNAMHALTVNRVPCNQRLADDPDVIVDNPPVLGRTHFSVGMIGVLNGILHAVDLPRVAYKLDDEVDAEGRHRFLGFCDVPGDVAGSKAKALFERVIREIDLNMQEISSESVESLGMHGVAKASIQGLTIAKLLVQTAMKEL
jgi:hypothetical protein